MAWAPIRYAVPSWPSPAVVMTGFSWERRWPSWALAGGREVFRPVLVGLHGRGQGREHQLRPDLAGQAERLQPGQQVLLHPGEREGGAPADDLLAEGVHGLQCGEIHLHVGLDVEHEPAQGTR